MGNERFYKICQDFDLSIHTDADELTARFTDEAQARTFFETLVWPDGPFCPHCKSVKVYRFNSVKTTRSGEARAPRVGLFECGNCAAQFTVKTFTPLHGTKLPLLKWIKALFYLLSSSKGVSSVVLARHLGVTQPTAWKMAHAVRELLDYRHESEPVLDGEVEIDTKRIGGEPRKDGYTKYVWNPRGKGSDKAIVVIMNAREGRVRTGVVSGESAAELASVIKAVVKPDAHLMTDGDKALAVVGRDFGGHSSVNHGAEEYARVERKDGKRPRKRRRNAELRDDERNVHVNHAEGFAGLLERSRFGVYHRFSRVHLSRYLDEAAWLWSSASSRTMTTTDGHSQGEVQAEPFVFQLMTLMPRALGRQIRWSAKGGLFWPPPLQDGDPPAPSRVLMLARAEEKDSKGHGLPRKYREAPKGTRRTRSLPGPVRLRATSPPLRPLRPAPPPPDYTDEEIDGLY
ncbi:transposase-like zinc ribbon protein [Azospirillum brasilense]|uniref:Transposase-like zinc ribbon protein n=1 Tax=Azospirillum brasilense TaxID=192 RepID=A0A560BER9_AZOBR|nr:MULTISPECIES: IS1595 family transposase [Azospirillum]TWA71127.1 transposase-like zinc ribbon protein [Azospirillum brasilense]